MSKVSYNKYLFLLVQLFQQRVVWSKTTETLMKVEYSNIVILLFLDVVFFLFLSQFSCHLFLNIYSYKVATANYPRTYIINW